MYRFMLGLMMNLSVEKYKMLTPIVIGTGNLEFEIYFLIFSN